VQARFTSVDPENAGTDDSDPQSWNGYAYARNNPVLYNDADGKTFKICYNNGNNSQEVSDEQFNQIKADATQLGSVFKNGTIYNEVDGKLVATATYQRTAFDDLSDQANAVIFGNSRSAGLVDRLEPVEKVVKKGFEIDSILIGGLTTIGQVGGTTLGLGTVRAATGYATKAAAREAVDALVASPAAKAAAKKAISRATAHSTIEVVEEAGIVYVRVKRPGFDGYQVVESVIKSDGSKEVVQKAYDASGRLVHYDPKN
jgi:hypothetical protein